MTAFVAGWLASFMVGAAATVMVTPAFVVAGTASGMAAAEVLLNTSLTLFQTAPLLVLALGQTPMWAMQLATVGLATTARGRSWRRDLGVAFRPMDLVIGAAGGLGAQLLIGLGYQLARVESDEPARQLTSKGSGLAGFIALLVLLALVAPLVEELLFRGLLQRGLAGYLPGWASVAISSGIFALVHFQVVQFPGLVVAGLVFGGLAQASGRLGPAIVAHVCFNASTVVVLALS